MRSSNATLDRMAKEQKERINEITSLCMPLTALAKKEDKPALHVLYLHAAALAQGA